MLRCTAVLGKVKVYEVGRFDRDLIIEPDGFDSVQGFIRRGAEFVVYSNDRVLVTHIIYYKFADTQFELTPSSAVPPNTTGQIVYITAPLSEFFGKLQQRAGPPNSPSNASIKRLIASLLKKHIEIDAFLCEVGKVLKAPPPDDLAGKIKSELEKCKLSPITGAASSSTTPSCSQSPMAFPPTLLPHLPTKSPGAVVHGIPHVGSACSLPCANAPGHTNAQLPTKSLAGAMVHGPQVSSACSLRLATAPPFGGQTLYGLAGGVGTGSTLSHDCADQHKVRQHAHAHMIIYKSYSTTVLPYLMFVSESYF